MRVGGDGMACMRQGGYVHVFKGCMNFVLWGKGHGGSWSRYFWFALSYRHLSIPFVPIFTP